MPHEFNRNNGPLFLTDRGLFSLVIRSLGYRGTEASGSREVHHMCVELWKIQLEVIKQLCVISAVLFESTRSFCLLFCLFVCPFQFILFVNHSMFDFFSFSIFFLFTIFYCFSLNVTSWERRIAQKKTADSEPLQDPDSDDLKESCSFFDY